MPTVTATPTCGGPVGTPGPWTVMAPYPAGVLESAAIATDGTYAYVAGGYVNLAGSNLLERYDPIANSWVALAPMFRPRTKIEGNLYLRRSSFVHCSAIPIRPAL